MKNLLILTLTLFLMGCVGSDKPNNPYTYQRSSKDAWWQTPYRANTPRAKNPWLKFVPVQKNVNEFDLWASDDLQRYGVDRLVDQDKIRVDSKAISKPQKKVKKTTPPKKKNDLKKDSDKKISQAI